MVIIAVDGEGVKVGQVVQLVTILVGHGSQPQL